MVQGGGVVQGGQGGGCEGEAGPGPGVACAVHV